MSKNVIRSAKPNEFILIENGFSGIRGDVEDELLPYGFVADIKNLTIDRVEGILKSVPNPTEVNSVKNAPTWTASTSISEGQIILPTTSNGHFYICTTAGTSDSTEPTWSTTEGATITDNTVTWTEAGSITGAVQNIFLWQKDNGTTSLFVQIGRSVCDVTNFLGHIFSDTNTVSFVSGMLDKMYIMHLTDGLYSYDGTTFSSISAAPKGRYIELWYNRLFVGGDLNDGSYVPYRVRWSNVNDFTTWDTKDFIDFRTPENSKITGIKPYKQALYVSTESSVSAVNLNFDNYQVYTGDIVPKDNLITLLNGFYFVSNYGLYALDNSDVPVKMDNPFKKYWNVSAPQSLASFGDYLYYLAKDSILVYDTVNKTYTRLVYGNESVLYSADHLYLGTTDGKVYELDVPDTGYLDWDLKTKVYNFNFKANKKRPLELRIYWQSTSATSFDIGAYYDYSDIVQHLGTVNYTPPGTIWGSFIWGEADWTSAQGSIIESSLYTYKDLIRTMQLEFSGTDEFGLSGIQIVFRPFKRYGR